MAKRSSGPSVEDARELMQLIQLRLPIKDRARTSVLSKSWLDAWSTIPNLRYRVFRRKHFEVVDRTMSRYLRDNIPIQILELNVDIENIDSAFLVEKWIRSVATKPTEVSLTFTLFGASLTIPDEILSSCKNLRKLTVASAAQVPVHSLWIKTPIANCVSLREVVLIGVRVSQEVLDAIFSSCRLLENIELRLHKQDGHGRAIKIKNLARLRELRIYSEDGDTIDLEISGVPNLWLFRCDLIFRRRDPRPRPFYARPISLGSNVTELWLGGLITDRSSLEAIKSGFPFLERLSLDMGCWPSNIFYFTCASIKRLSLLGSPPPQHWLIDVEVYAPKLIDFLFFGYALPSLSFPVSTLAQITINLLLDAPESDVSFFLKMREALTLSTNCYLSISTKRISNIDIDLDDLRARLPFPPANNVQRLEFHTIPVEDDRGSPFFDAFFEICHPKHVHAKPDLISGKTSNHFFKLMLREVLEKKKKKKKKKKNEVVVEETTTREWRRCLKRVQIRCCDKWETLRISHGRSDNFIAVPIRFNLNWR